MIDRESLCSLTALAVLPIPNTPISIAPKCQALLARTEQSQQEGHKGRRHEKKGEKNTLSRDQQREKAPQLPRNRTRGQKAMTRTKNPEKSMSSNIIGRSLSSCSFSFLMKIPAPDASTGLCFACRMHGWCMFPIRVSSTFWVALLKCFNNSSILCIILSFPMIMNGFLTIYCRRIDIRDCLDDGKLQSLRKINNDNRGSFWL
ncbi:hypothetical protein D5086_025728 [Populus alba]|uniref:Uncharacterized protein n=1 Tax=Populus alba TaxID=43335 RepID=A0ACC4B0S6_POPAL